MQMSARERLLAALRGQAVDRLPWSPFLAYWWDFQPKAMQDRGQVAFLREIGADALLRGFTTAFTCSDVQGISQYESFIEPIPGVEFRREEKGDLWRNTSPPVGVDQPAGAAGHALVGTVKAKRITRSTLHHQRMLINASCCSARSMM
jgi:hypothetical protein